MATEIFPTSKAVTLIERIGLEYLYESVRGSDGNFHRQRTSYFNLEVKISPIQALSTKDAAAALRLLADSLEKSGSISEAVGFLTEEDLKEFY